MGECIFCNIVAKKNKAYIVYENEQTVALLDIFPSVTAHMMVIPKKHGATVQDYTLGELGEVMATVSRMTKALEIAYNTKVFTIGINHGEVLGVPHLHVHILPRQENDGGGIIQSVVKKEVKKGFEEVVNKIKKVVINV